eukprot:2097257-Rhodomonas_salina.11
MQAALAKLESEVCIGRTSAMRMSDPDMRLLCQVQYTGRNAVHSTGTRVYCHFPTPRPVLTYSMVRNCECGSVERTGRGGRGQVERRAVRAYAYQILMLVLTEANGGTGG